MVPTIALLDEQIAEKIDKTLVEPWLMSICEHGIPVKNFKFPKDHHTGKFGQLNILLEPDRECLVFY